MAYYHPIYIHCLEWIIEKKNTNDFFYLILSIDKNIVINKRIYFNDNRCDWEQGFNNLAEYMEIDVSSSALLNEHSWLLFRIIIESLIWKLYEKQKQEFYRVRNRLFHTRQ
jgi:hypothetical protein